MQLSALAGAWRIERTIDDRRAGCAGRFDGRAVFAPGAGGGLDYSEEGRLRMGTGPALAASRRLRWQEGAGGIEVLFADGRPFHGFPAGQAEARAVHDCPPDRYAVSYDFRAWPLWRATWEVSGPRKDYRMVTSYTREGSRGGTGLVLSLAAVLLAGSAGGAAAAPELPTLFRVTGVAAGGALNVRPGPDTSAAPVARLPAGTRDVEVVATDASGEWGRVNVGEGGGWASLRYLQEERGVWPGEGLPASLSCFGTEPFWSLRPDGTGVVLERLGSDPERIAPVAVTASGPRERRLAFGEGGLELAPAECSDGMSDRAFGLAAELRLGDELLRGCCSVAPRGR